MRRCGGLERRRPAADIAEHEAGAGSGRRLQGADRAVQQVERDPRAGRVQQRAGQRELERDADEDRTPVHGTSVLTTEPGRGAEHQDAEQRLRLLEHALNGDQALSLPASTAT